MRHPLDQLIALSRRGLLRGTLSVGAIAALTGTTAQRTWAAPVFAAYPFTLGVASGDPLPDGVVIWTRLAPEPHAGGGLPAQAIEVGWEVAADDRFRTPVAKGTVLARPELGHAVHVEVGGLEPGRPYWYRFQAGREISAIGRTRTAPAPDAMPDRVAFANVGCQRYEDGWFTAFRHLSREDLDFVFHSGDYIYEYRNRRGAAVPVREITGQEIHTVVDYRNRYALYRLDADLQAAHAAHPFIVSFDDHEVDNNWAGDISEEDGGPNFPIAVPNDVFLLRRQMAFQAWYEHMPVRRAQVPRGPDMLAHRRFDYGRLVSVNVLDTRQHRNDQPCGDGTRVGCADRLKPDAQILGAAQERWLMDGLASGRATWNVLAQQVMMMQRRVGEGPDFGFSMDKWDAYAAARSRLLGFVQENRVPNLVVLTGDVHNSWAGDLKPDFNDDRSPVVGSEFVGTSISTDGDGAESRADWETLQRNNPHMKFFNNRRGYTVHAASRERMTAEFRVVPFVTRRDAPLETRASFLVEAGRPGVQRGG